MSSPLTWGLQRSWMFAKKTVLENGITVVTENMPGAKSVSLGFWVLTGSVDETPAQAGLSHFLEHMLFKGTPSHTAIGLSRAFDALGAEVNAFTGKEHTCFYTRMIDSNLQAAFELLADMFSNPSFEPDAVELEREVVLEEIAACEDTPEDYVYELFCAELFSHSALGKPVLGSKDTVCAFTSDDLRAYHRANYTTGNVVVVACGNVDHARVAELAAQNLSALPLGVRRERPAFCAAAESGLAALKRAGEQAHLVIGCPSVSADDPERFACQIVDSALGGSMSSRLFDEIRERRGLVYSVYTMSQLYNGVGQFELYAATRPENIAEVSQVARAELKRMAQSGLKPEEFERVREMVCGSYVLNLESCHDHMVRLGKMSMSGLELCPIDSTIEAYRSLTIDQVNDAAAHLLAQELTAAVISPFNEHDIERMVF